MTSAETDPDKLARLKAIVETYERELMENYEAYEKWAKEDHSKTSKTVLNALVFEKVEKESLTAGKLIEAYREYVKELEKYAPR